MRSMFLAALAAFVLTACGGGAPDDENTDTMPVKCEARPEGCK